MKCGTKVPPQAEEDKKKKGKKKRSKIRFLILFFIVLILAALGFLIFGGDKVPEKIRDMKGYANLTATVKEVLPDDVKLPVQVKLPFDLPHEFPFDFKLPDLPKPGDLFGSYGGKDQKQAVEAEKNDKKPADSKDKQKSESKDANKDAAKGKEDDKTAAAVEVNSKYSEKEQKVIRAGVDDGIVVGNADLFSDGAIDWNYDKVELQGHNTDLSTGTDTVVVYLEMSNQYVNMTGTKEITYQYDEQTGKWEAGPVSKINCKSIEPVNAT
ncbi:MAG TPA: hypothetical protein PKA19_15750 [Bacillota bacterium]|nr:hypothetical protein [Bacillota bacterium]